MLISRDWATPLTIASFAIMSVTGVLMFFHLDSGLNKAVHEWAGWAMVAGVAAHAIVNWKPLTRYFVASRLGQTIIALGAATLLASFIALPSGDGGQFPPPVLAMKAITHAPIASIAPLTGRSVEQMMSDLAKGGITLPNAQASIAAAAGENREAEAAAMRILFRKG